MNKYDIAHGLRTLTVGLLTLGLIPLPFIFMGPINADTATQYIFGLLLLLIVAVVSQVFVMRYKSLRNTSDARKSAERVYSVIGLSVIGLFFAAILVLWWLGQNRY